ncbi:MAG: DUF2744 domain-containing protein [Actinobacteria bacterium]|nr:DUF2744 domain-containing protein [Actinomycetota bacterium]
MRRGEFPLQERCNYKKKREFMAWMMVALPQMNGAALPMSAEYIQLVSEHFWDCGARIPLGKDGQPKFQRKWWHPPGLNDPHWLTNPGRWIYGKRPKKDPGQQVNMVTVLEAFKKADEKGFFEAIKDVADAGERQSE